MPIPAEDNPYPHVKVAETAAASVPTPAAGKQHVFIDTDHVLKRKDSAAAVTTIEGGSGTVTHTGGALTSGKTVVGAGSADVAVSTLTATVVKSASGTLSAATGGTDYADNAFKTIAVSGQSDVVADSAADTLTLAAGSNITITTNASTDTITIAASGSGSGTVTHTGGLTSGQLVTGNGTDDITVGNLSGDVTTSGSMATTLKTAAKTRAITFAIDGGGSALTTGVKADVYIPYACTITAVTMLADQSGSAVVDIWKDSYANYPPTNADSITASAKPTLSSATKSQDSTLTGWTTSISAGDSLRFNIDSASTLTRLALTLTVTV